MSATLSGRVRQAAPRRSHAAASQQVIGMSGSTRVLEVPREDAVDERDRPWNVIVWNDPVTLMSYVVYILRKLFGFDEPRATRLMLQIHHEGRAVVASGPREKSEMDVHRLHAHGLQATLSQD